MGAYDVGADRLWGHVEARSVNAKVVLEFLKDIRRRYPPEVQVYIVMDGLSAHWTPEIRDWRSPITSACCPRRPTPATSTGSNASSGPMSSSSSTAPTTPTGLSSPKPPRPTSAAATATTTTRSSENSKTAAESPDRVNGGTKGADPLGE